MQDNNIPVLTPLTCETVIEVRHLRVLGLFSISLNTTETYINIALTDRHLLYF